jgi:hypothetical protein
MNKRLAKLKNIQEANISFLNRNTKKSLNEGMGHDDDYDEVWNGNDENELNIDEDDMINTTPNLKKQQSSQEKMLYDFLIGINNISKNNLGWIPEPTNKNASNVAKLTPNLLGKFSTYFTDAYGSTIKKNEPLYWGLYPLNPPKKQEGVYCYITNKNGSLQIHINGGKTMMGMTNSLYGENLSPNVVQDALNKLKKLLEMFQERNR